MISYIDQSEHSPGYQFIPKQKIPELIEMSKYDLSLEQPQNSETLSMTLYKQLNLESLKLLPEYLSSFICNSTSH